MTDGRSATQRNATTQHCTSTRTHGENKTMGKKGNVTQIAFKPQTATRQEGREPSLLSVPPLAIRDYLEMASLS